jgi:hypothetical protein
MTAIAANRTQPRRVTGSRYGRRWLCLRESPDLPIEIGLLTEELLLFREVRLPRRIWAGHATDPGKLLIDALQLALEAFEFAGGDRRRRSGRILRRGGRSRLRGGARCGRAGRAGFVVDPLSIERNVFEITRPA